jgi:hypothetical protein
MLPIVAHAGEGAKGHEKTAPRSYLRGGLERETGFDPIVFIILS